MHILFRIYFKLEQMIMNERIRRLKKRFKFCGQGVRLDPTCRIFVPGEIEIGDATSISSYTTIYATFGVKIGKNCFISSNCGISSYNHIQNSLNRHQDKQGDWRFSKPVVIGDNVWIGMNACILPGVEIGDNSIIGSGSIVTKSVPSNEIWVGNPARFVKRLSIDDLAETKADKDVVCSYSNLQP